MLRTIRLCMSIVALMTLFSLQQAHAQVCTPDTSFKSPGLYPDTLPGACVNLPYATTATIVIPQDTVVNVPPIGNLTLPIDSIQLLSLRNLPATMSYQCNPPSCGFPGNTSGCVEVTGTPTATGTITLKAIVDVWVTVPIAGSTSVRDSTFTFDLIVGTAPVVNITSATVSGAPKFCMGDTAILDAGAGFDAYLWTTGDTTRTIKVTASGNYGVKIWAGGCIDSVGMSLAPLAGPSVMTSVVDANCGLSNGSATASATGGGPFNFLWSNMGTSPTINGLAAGPYDVTVTDTNGCQSMASVIVGSVGGASAMIDSVTDVSCAGANDGGVMVTASGGMMPYNFSWSNGATTQNLSGVGPGSYTLTLTDGNNCVTTVMAMVTEPTALSAFKGPQVDPLCNGGMTGSALLSPVGGTMPYTYSWSNGQTTVGASGLSAGTFMGYVIDANGCQDSASFTLSEPPAIMTSQTTEDPLCNGDTNGQIGLAVQGGTPGYTYAWSNGATTATITGLGAGSYTCTVMDINGCTDTVSAMLIDPPMLTAMTSHVNTQPGMATGQASVTPAGGTPPYTYDWNSGQTDSLITGLVEGTYIVTVVDANGCEVQDAVIIDVLSSIEDELAAGIRDWELYPNPTSQNLNIKLTLDRPTDMAISLYDIQGRKVHSINKENVQIIGYQLDMSILPQGLYLLKVQTARGQAVRRVVKK